MKMKRRLEGPVKTVTTGAVGQILKARSVDAVDVRLAQRRAGKRVAAQPGIAQLHQRIVRTGGKIDGVAHNRITGRFRLAERLA